MTIAEKRAALGDMAFGLSDEQVEALWSLQNDQQPALPTWADPAAQLPRIKKHLRVDSGEHDDLLMAYFQAAIDELSGPTGSLCRQLVPAVVRTRLTRSGGFLPLPPVIEIIGFEAYVGGEWVEDAYASGWIEPNGRIHWQGGAGLRVVAHHGYLDADVPANLTVALLLMVQQSHEGFNEARAMAIRSLLAGLKVPA